MLQRFIVVSILILFVSACVSNEPISVGIVSTPVADLPINFDSPPLIQATAIPPAIVQEADAEYMLLSNIYERSIPSVVNVEADLPGGTPQSPNVNRGSGFIYDNTGHIITNAHVVQNSITIRVTFNDGYVTTADLIGIDTYSDIAIIRVNTDASRLLPMNLISDSDLIRVGQRAIAIGNPFGLSGSMAMGIISGLGTKFAIG